MGVLSTVQSLFRTIIQKQNILQPTIKGLLLYNSMKHLKKKVLAFICNIVRLESCVFHPCSDVRNSKAVKNTKLQWYMISSLTCLWEQNHTYGESDAVSRRPITLQNPPSLCTDGDRQGISMLVMAFSYSGKLVAESMIKNVMLSLTYLSYPGSKF